MIEYQLTPWNTKAFGVKAAEITIDSSDDIAQYPLMEESLKSSGVRFVSTRITSNDFLLRKKLQQQGFYFAESSLLMKKIKLQYFEYQKLPKIHYTTYTSDDLESIKKIAADSFHYSRFHEDSTIPLHQVKERYTNWIDDLITQSTQIMVGKVGKKIIGFNIQKVQNQHVSLILTGCAENYQIYALSLWNEILEDNKMNGKKQIKALISTSNIGVTNLYIHFGFKVEATYFGFHKWL